MQKDTLMCARAHFVGTKLTNSITAKPGYGLVETFEKFRLYFSEKFPDKPMQKIELFLTESDMHAERKPFSVLSF